MSENTSPPYPEDNKGDILDQSVRNFITATASKSPTPGGGSIAALAGAVAAALAQMCVQYTLGKKKYEEHRLVLEQGIERLDRYARLMQDFVQEDIAAYQNLSGFMRLSEADRQLHPEYAPAVRRAIEAPLNVAGLALHILEECDRLLDKTSEWLLSDLGIAALLAHATVGASELNVLANLRLVDSQQAQTYRLKLQDNTLKADLLLNGIRGHMAQTYGPRP
ncbi:MAG: cyclodeaminase/cyclohydrolase family protein [Phycisphaerae bacterium]